MVFRDTMVAELILMVEIFEITESVYIGNRLSTRRRLEGSADYMFRDRLFFLTTFMLMVSFSVAPECVIIVLMETTLSNPTWHSTVVVIVVVVLSL